MALKSLALLSLVCSIFGTTSEPTHHGRSVIYGDLSKPKIQTNVTLTLYTDELRRPNEMRHYNVNTKSKRETNNDPCEAFTFRPGKKRRLTHPKAPEDPSRPGESTYTKNTTCFTTIEAPENGQVISLTFIDVFEIEGDPPHCKYDYLEIRDGRYGYATPVYKFCGHNFPPTITSTGPFMWLKFHSDDIIEYAGFTIDIDFPTKATSKRISDACYRVVTHQKTGIIDSNSEDLKQCREISGALDIQWKIETAPGTQIYLRITKFQLADPNNCSANSVQIFGAEPNFDHDLGVYCSSVAQSVITAPESKGLGPGNIMYVRVYTERRLTNFSALFTEFRVAAECDKKTEFDCLDGTCIAENLGCDGSPNCRLKTDEDPVDCKGEAQSLVTENRTILIVFSLILSGIIFVLLFKCVRKAYQDQKKINAARANLCSLLSVDKTASQVTLNPKFGKDFDPCSLESENRANEMYRQNIQQSSSSGSEFSPDPDDWPEAVPILPADVKVERQGRPARDFSLREELLRAKGKQESENRDAAVGPPDLNEAECQTRESLFLTDPITKPGTKSGTVSRVISGVGSLSPAPVEPPGLLRQATVPDTQTGRPMSSETTRSAPDVIIVSPSQLVEDRT